MRISVFGLGYVGTTNAVCLAADGHEVIGVDSNPRKVASLMAGRSPVVEADLESMIAQALDAERLTATTDHALAVSESDVAVICVGTPSLDDGGADLTALRTVVRQIGSSLAGQHRPFTVILRSTVRPGTSRGVVVPLLEDASGRRADEALSVCFVPEFLREGSSVADYYSPPKVVVASTSASGADVALELMPAADSPVDVVDFEVAELVKYVDNAWHGLKVGFANEIGRLGKSLGIDSRAVMDIFAGDTKLNISSRYLAPGFAFGGSCLPKDLRAINHTGRISNIDLPILGSILQSNESHLRSALELVLSMQGRRVGVLGLSFKAGTDDLRESPMVEMVERLIGKGYDVSIFDPAVNIAALVGSNQTFIVNQIEHIGRLMAPSVDEVLERSEIIVVGNRSPEFKDILDRVRPEQTVVDLVGMFEGRVEGVHGVCW